MVQKFYALRCTCHAFVEVQVTSDRLPKEKHDFSPKTADSLVRIFSTLFTVPTGGSGVTILALGGLLFHALREDRYPERFSLGLLTGSGSLGLLFPPALPLILYGIVARIPIDALWQLLKEPLDSQFATEPPASVNQVFPEVQLGATQMSAIFGSRLDVVRLESSGNFMHLFGGRLMVAADLSKLRILEVRSLLSLALTLVKLGYAPLLKLRLDSTEGTLSVIQGYDHIPLSAKTSK